MITLIKTEVKYFGLQLVLILLLLLAFTAFSLNDIKIFVQIYFLKTYFWSAIIGLGVYGLVFIIWSIRKKEMRERVHALIPMSVKSISISRWLFGIIPFVLVGFYIQ
jgi:uncharacterized membrane protein YqjE